MAVRGLAGVHQRKEELDSRRTNFGLRRFTTEFRWDGNKPPSENALLLRILGDDIIIATQRHLVPLQDNKFFFGICRHAFPIEASYCYVCDVLAKEFDGDAKAKKRIGYIPTDIAVALAVEMEMKMGGYKVKMVDFEIPALHESEAKGEASEDTKEYRKLLNTLGKPGDKVSIPNIGLMIGTIAGKQGLFDFATRRDTISDRVYEISRYGVQLDTVWDWNHNGPDKDDPDPSGMLKEFMGKYPFEMPEEWVVKNASEDKYNFFFKLNAGAAGDGQEASSAADSKDDEEDPASTSRKSLMAKIHGKK